MDWEYVDGPKDSENKSKRVKLDGHEGANKRIKLLHAHSCMPVNGVDYSGRRQLFATLRSKVLRNGVPRRTVTVGSPVFPRQPGEELRPLRILFDSGSEGDLFFVRRKDLEPYDSYEKAFPTSWGTSSGRFKTRMMAKINLLLPEFSQNKVMSVEPDVKVVDDDHTFSYDLIIGIETLAQWGAILDFFEGTMTIDGQTIPLREHTALDDKRRLMNIYRAATEPAATKEETERVTRILDAKYDAADLPKIVEENCSHLTARQKGALLKLLQSYESMFQGKLGKWVGEEVHFELQEGARPWQGRPYPVPRVHRQTVMNEIKRLCDIGVLEPVNEDSKWGSPSFIIPKPNGTVRFLTDFRELNKRIVRKPYPLPKIAETLQQMEKFTYASAIDLNMGYYHLELDAYTMEICTVVFPWGKYRYRRLPMGAACAPDIFQARMGMLFTELEYVRVYIDDLLVITSEDFDDHLQKLGVVLQRLSEKGLQVNAAKSIFCALEVDYLGYTLTRDGIRPQQKKVNAILALQPPKNVKDLRRILGIVQYYRDIWEKRTDLLAPLTDLVAECGTTKAAKKKLRKDGKPTKLPKPWRWEAEHDEAFKKIKQIIARDVCLAYPQFDKPFVIFTDASTRQLGGVITQDNRPIAFFSRKLTKAQQRYTVTELELLSIVELLKEFKGMLLGYEVIVWTDHKNLTRDNLGESSDRVMRWKLLLNEYDLKIQYIRGVDNTVADAISRLDYCPKKNPHPEDADAFADDEDMEVQKWNNCISLLSHYQDEAEDMVDDEVEQSAHRECWSHEVFAQELDEEDELYPVTIREIADAQRADEKLLKLFQNPDKERHIKPLMLEEEIVLCQVEDKNRPRLVVPEALQSKVVEWYHHYLQHPGRDRLEETLTQSLYWRGMRADIKKFTRKCHRCQLGKKRKRKYGHLPPKEAETIPWRTVCVDLIGPYTITGADNTALEFMCMTMIDPATGWFEVVELPTVEIIKKKDGQEIVVEEFDKTSACISYLFNKTWLSRYPRPRQVVCDNGSEFKLHFTELLKQYSVNRKPTTAKNPQANAVLERIHGVFGDMMRTSGINNREVVDARLIDDFITNAAWAIRSTYHTVLRATPGAAIFGRDMLFDIPFLANWTEIGRRRQELVDSSNARENRRRVPFDYQPGTKVLVIKNTDGKPLPKAEDKNEGPYEVTHVYTNGTVRIQRGTINERLNIRRLTPYFEGSEDATMEA